MIRDEELKAIVKLVSTALEQLGIPYAIGGSGASSVRGIPRTTQDIDFVAQIVPQQAEALAAALGGEVSDRQWNDLSDIIATNPALDRDYLNLWAARLGVTRLLEKAFADVANDSFMP
jgi:hypothetical protein